MASAIVTVGREKKGGDGGAQVVDEEEDGAEGSDGRRRREGVEGKREGRAVAGWRRLAQSVCFVRPLVITRRMSRSSRCCHADVTFSEASPAFYLLWQGTGGLWGVLCCSSRPRRSPCSALA